MQVFEMNCEHSQWSPIQFLPNIPMGYSHNILVIFSLLFRNLRLFLSLLMMETQLPINLTLVNKIKREAVMFGLYEAFLESAPQLILQMSIILRRGYLSKIFIHIFKYSLALVYCDSHWKNSVQKFTFNCLI